MRAALLGELEVDLLAAPRPQRMLVLVVEVVEVRVPGGRLLLEGLEGGPGLALARLGVMVVVLFTLLLEGLEGVD